MGKSIRAAMGKRVEKRLDRHPDITIFNRNNLSIFLIKNFIDVGEREYIKNIIFSNSDRSQTMGDAYSEISDFRTSSTSMLIPDDPIIKQVDYRISDILGIEDSNAESTQGQHYTVGQTFKPHCDFMQESRSHWKAARREGGQRVWTAMAYLDDDMEGGETRFVRAGFSIKPVAGMLVLWSNVTKDGDVNWLTLHEGAPVKRGEKTIITKWYRERRWIRRPGGEIAI